MATTTPSVIAGLAGRLTNTQDRETYSALMCYLNRLPPGDEFRQLAELLGLLSLVGQRIPNALADFLGEFRAQTKIAVEYQGRCKHAWPTCLRKSERVSIRLQSLRK